MNRRSFLISTSAIAALSALDIRSSNALAPIDEDVADKSTLKWTTSGLNFEFLVVQNRLRQLQLLPEDFYVSKLSKINSSGVEVALQCAGENSLDPAMKQAGGSPGNRIFFVGKREDRTLEGPKLVLEHTDPELGLKVESFYQGFYEVPVVRRHTRLTNTGSQSIGIEYLSSAMLHGLANPVRYDNEMKIHLAYNSWMAEGQWHSLRPSELGFVENERTSWSEASCSSIGTWSTEKYLPMAAVENTKLGVIWFWQIEHNGSWHWEISNTATRGNIADNIYAYLGGPDALHSLAWKNLQPGQSYTTVPVAIGCAHGSFGEAVELMTEYRRKFCVRRRQDGNRACPVIFNDYMNCLEGDPTEEKERPLIDAAAEMGCEYFVIDAGWYAEKNEDWSATVGSWEPSKSRWPHGIEYTMNYIRSKGMIPGLWLEPEVAGMHSALAQKPDNWFFIRHGKRVIKNSRLFLDFRNPEVRDYLDEVIERLVHEYGVGYIKMDYNADGLEGTELHADSFGQGLLEENRAYLAWLDTILQRYPKIVIENCGSGGGRMDYAMLSRLQLQSGSDQEEYLNLPAIVTGESAAVLPEQLAIWSYPLEHSDADQASFNMVNAMLCRIHQSGHLAKLTPEAAFQVKHGIEVYKHQIREHIAEAAPFYLAGMPSVVDRRTPVIMGMRSPRRTFMAVWCLDGEAEINIPIRTRNAKIIYPSDSGTQLVRSGNMLEVKFPRSKMACIISIE